MTPERAEPWHYLTNDFLPKNREFTWQDLLDGLMDVLRYHSEMHLGTGSKPHKTILRKIKECYTEEHGLGALGLVRIEGEKFVRGKTAKKQGPRKTTEKLTNAYGLKLLDSCKRNQLADRLHVFIAS